MATASVYRTRISQSQLTLSLPSPLPDQGARGSKQLQKPGSHRSSFGVPPFPGFLSTFQLPSYFCSHIPFVCAYLPGLPLTLA